MGSEGKFICLSCARRCRVKVPLEAKWARSTCDYCGNNRSVVPTPHDPWFDEFLQLLRNAQPIANTDRLEAHVQERA